MATKINFGTQCSLADAAKTIMAVGPEVCFMLEGEPGIGKSSLLKVMKAAHGERYAYSYMDCTTLDLGDIAMPKVEKEGKIFVTHYAPNARFRLQDEKPVIIMLDEVTKAPEPVKNMLLPLIQERRLGDVPLPQGSI